MQGLRLRLNKDTPGIISSILLITLLILYSYVTSNTRALIAVMTIFMIIIAIISSRKKKEATLPKLFIVINVMCVAFLVLRNLDFAQGMYGRFLYTLVGMLFVIGMARTTRWIDITIKILYISGLAALVVAFAGGSNSLTDLIILVLLQALMAIVLSNVYLERHIFKNLLILTLIYIEFFLIGKLAYILFTGCAILVLHFIKKAETNRKKMTFSFLFLLVLVMAYVFFSFVGFGKMTEWMFSDDVANGRTLLFKKAIEYFLKEPIFGLGWGGFRNTFNIQRDGIYYEVHNIYLQLLCEIGIIGTVFYILYLITNMRQGIITLKAARDLRDMKSINQLFFSIYLQVFFLFYGISGNFLYDLSFLLYSLAAAIPWAISRRIKDEAKK